MKFIGSDGRRVSRKNTSGYRNVCRKNPGIRGQASWVSRLSIQGEIFTIANRVDPAVAAAMAERVAQIWYDDAYCPPPYELPALSDIDDKKAINKALQIIRALDGSC